MKSKSIETEVWQAIWTFCQRTDVAMAMGGALAGYLIGDGVVNSLLRDPIQSSNLLAGFSHASEFLRMWNPVMGGLIAYAGTKIVSSMISINAMSEDDLMDIRTNENGFIYKLQPWPETKGLQLTLGEAHGGDPNKRNFVDNPPWFTIPTSGLWGNVIAFGMIGSGKTQSVIYPLLKSCLAYRPLDDKYKIGGLVLDVKGDFTKTLRQYMSDVGRDDLLVVQPGGNQVWNPVHSPSTPADVLAGRLLAVYENMSGGTSSDNSWVVDGVRKLLWHSLGIHRCVFGYVTISDINTIITKTSASVQSDMNSSDDQTQTQEYINSTYNNIWLIDVENRTEEEISEYSMHYEYFVTEWSNESEKQKAIYVSSCTSITGGFEKSDIKKTFCPGESAITFNGFDDVIDNGTVVILDCPEVSYGQLAQMLGIMLKLDFQRSALQRIPRQAKDSNVNVERPLMLVIDEYQNFVTVSSQSTPQGDDNFYALSRQSKCMCLCASQAPISLEAKIGKEKMRVILASVLTKICLGLSDYENAEWMASLFGKERQSFESYNIGENSGGTYNLLTGNVGGKNSGVSQTSNYSNEDTFIVQPTTIMSLKRHEAIVYAYGTTGMMRPERVYLKTTYIPDDLKDQYKNARDVPYNLLIKSIELKAQKDTDEGVI